MGQLGHKVKRSRAPRKTAARSGTLKASEVKAAGARPMASARPERPSLVLVYLLVLAAFGASWLASAPWLRAYQVDGAAYLLALAAGVPVLTSAAVSRGLRFGPVVSYAVSATGLVLLLGASNRFSYGLVWEGLAHVPAQLLSETLPLGGGAYLLAAPLALTWLCSAATAELLLRPSKPAPLALAVPLAAFATAFTATTSAPASETTLEATGLLCVLVAAALARQGLLETSVAPAREDPTTAGLGTGTAFMRAMATSGGAALHGRRNSSLRRATTGATLAAGLAATLGLVVPALPALASRPATVSRPTQLLSATVVNPLDALAAMRFSDPGAPAVPLFTLKVSEPWDGYIAVAPLDVYDGDTWSLSTATFRPTGGRVPGQATNDPGTREVDQRYQIEHSIGLPFLPAVERPVEVGGLAADADAGTGMLAADLTLPASYQVVSQSPVGTGTTLRPASQLLPASAVPGGDGAAYTNLPAASAKDVAAAVRFAVNLTGRPASPTFAFLQTLAGALRVQEKRVVPRPRSGAGTLPAALAGTSLAQVMNAVTVDRAATPEQFATFFAVVARYLGVPARVVTGFRCPAAASAQALLPAGRYLLTNRDAWAWAEVPLLGYGWVVLDPTPVATTTAVSAPPEQVTPAPPSKSDQATALPGQSGLSHGRAKPVNVRIALPLRVEWSLIFGAVVPASVVGVLLTWFLVWPAIRRRLRRIARHQPGDPALTVVGAWLELLDGLCRLGLEVAPSATSTDIVAEVAEHFGEEFMASTQAVASLADQALYCTEPALDEATAELAWRSEHRLYHDLRGRAGRRARARSFVLVGPAPARPSSPS